MTPTSPVRVRIVGPIRVEGPGGTLDERALGGRQGRLAFAVLAATRHRPVPKEELADALWPGELPASWQAALRGVVTKVRTALSSAGLDGASAIRSAFGCYQLELPPGASVDLEAAAVAVEEAEAAIAAGNPAVARRLAESAAGIVSQPFLPGEEATFPEGIRRHLEALHLRTLDVLGHAGLAAQDVGAAIEAAEAALAIEPFRESAHRLLMSAYATAGSRGEALRAYERCRVLLADELGVRPSPETEAAYLSLLGDSLPPFAGRDPPAAPAVVVGSRRGPRLPALPDDPFVGREVEVSILADALAAAADGQRHVVLISGELGVGKTRLALEAAWDAEASGATVLYGAATDSGVLPYEPVNNALTRYVATCSDQRLAALLSEPATALLRLLPDAAARLPHLRPPASVDAETDRALLFSAVTAFLRRLAGDAPVVAVLDDLHWAAVPPLLLTAHLIRALADSRLLVVATYRKEDESRDLSAILAGLARQPGVRHIHLEGLDDKAVAALVASSGIDPRTVLTRLLVTRTGGNPFFIKELLTHARGDGPATAVPESVHQLVAHRLRGLPPSAARLVGLAAVAGVEFDLALLEQVSAADRDDLLDDLDEACRVRLVEEVAGGRYRFCHSLVRDVVYGQLGETRRARLHQRVGEALEAAGAASMLPGVAALARHFTAAGMLGDQSKAVDYTLAAGDGYLETTAYERAARVYASALAILDRGRDDPARRCEALVRLGDAQRRAGKPSHRETLLDAARLAERLGDADRLARAALVNSRLWSVLGDVDRERVATLEAALSANPDRNATRARLLAHLAAELTFSPPDRERRRELSADAVTIARSLDDDDTLATVLVAHCAAIWDPDTLSKRRNHIAEADRLVARHDPFLQVMVGLRRWDFGVEAADLDDAGAGLAVARRVADDVARPGLRWQVKVRETTRAMILGRLAEAAQSLGEAHELGLLSGQPDAETILVAQLYFLRREQGRLGELADVVDRAASRNPIPGWRAAVAAIHHDAGQRDEARAALEAYMSGEYAELPFDQGWLLLTTVLAEVSAGLDHPGSADVLYPRLLPYRGQLAIRPPGSTGSVDRHLGELAVTLGRFDDAARHLRRATALYTRLGSPGWLARTQVASARLLLRRARPGDRRRALRLLDEAGATARRLGLRGVEGEAQALAGP